MRNSDLPKTIRKWIDANPEKIDEYYMERDEFDGDNNAWSIWLYLKRPYWNKLDEIHMIHEARVVDFMERTRFIERCDCCVQDNTNGHGSDGHMTHPQFQSGVTYLSDRNN